MRDIRLVLSDYNKCKRGIKVVIAMAIATVVMGCLDLYFTSSITNDFYIIFLSCVVLYFMKKARLRKYEYEIIDIHLASNKELADEIEEEYIEQEEVVEKKMTMREVLDNKKWVHDEFDKNLKKYRNYQRTRLRKIMKEIVNDYTSEFKK